MKVNFQNTTKKLTAFQHAHKVIFLTPYSFLFCLFMVVELKVHSQIKTPLHLNTIDTTERLKVDILIPQDTLLKKQEKNSNSLFKKTIKKFIIDTVPELNKHSIDSISTIMFTKVSTKRPFLVFKNGFITFNYAYRSSLDTPYIESNIQQQASSFNANVLLWQKLPLKVSVLERKSNSIYFRNYMDVRIEFNAPEFHRLQSEKLVNYFNAVIARLENPKIKDGMEIERNTVISLKGYLNRPALIKKFLQSKEAVINIQELPGSQEHKDSVIKEASEFIALYERKQNDVKKAEKRFDSLRSEYIALHKKIQQLRQVFKRNINFPGGPKLITQSLKEAGLHDRRFEKLTNALYSVRKFAIGKTVPDYTNLTVKDIGVNGINLEFNNKDLYVAVVAGLIDFSARDFVFNKYQSYRQYVTAGRIGWGRKEGNHIILSGYKGQKQIFSPQLQNNSISIFGLSIESQFVLNKNIRLITEIAQSTIAPSPGFLLDSSRKGFSLRDNNSRALSLQVYSYFPLTRTRINGLYEHQGVNFQSFNAYKANGSTDAWNLKADQYLLSGLLHLTAGVHKNDYANPLIQQNYSSNTIFTTFTATFHKRFWPLVSVGYIPSSQYSIIDDQLYESRYQAFNLNVTDVYKIASVNASTAIMYNHFYNDSKDSGFVYYNAHNLFINQNILFAKYAAGITISHTQNSQYLLDVMEGSLSKNVKELTTIGLGIKLDHLNSEENKIGYFIKAKYPFGEPHHCCEVTAA